MELFATDLERLGFLLEADAAFQVELGALESEAASDGSAGTQEELPPEQRPKYITYYVGSKQKLVDWIWRNTPQDVKSAVDVFSGSAVVEYMFKTKGLSVVANDRYYYCHHAVRPQ